MIIKISIAASFGTPVSQRSHAPNVKLHLD